MATLEATPQPAYGRIALTVNQPADPLTVERNSGSGWAVARLALVSQTPGVVAIFADYEAQPDVPVTYRHNGAVSPTVTLASLGKTWWKPLPYPALSMPVTVIGGLLERTFATETVDLFPLGAKSPITVSGSRRMPSSDLVLATLTRQEGVRFNDGLARSPVCLFQPPGRPQVYLSVGEVTRQAATRLLQEEAAVWSLEVQEREMPSVVWSYPAGASWGTYKNAAATWQDWRDGQWLDVLLGSV